MPTLTKIKYRVYSKKLGKHLDVHYPLISPDGRLYLYYEGNLLEEKEGFDDFVVQRFTGFCDSQGNEIYEGDALCDSNDMQVHIVFIESRQCFGFWYRSYQDKIVDLKNVSIIK